jgi:lipopolysaccharide export system protein LptC
MRDRLTMLVAIVLLAAVAATSFWYSRALRRPPAAERPTPGTPDFVVDRLVLTQFDEAGRAKHKLFAERLTHFSENDDIELANPRLVSLRPDRPQIEARAERARVENAGERVHLRGSVVLTRTADGAEPPLRLTTEYLLANPDYDRYSTDTPVQIERGTDRMQANSMELDNIARTTQLAGDVKTQLAPPAQR